MSAVDDALTLIKWAVPFGIACRRAAEQHGVPFDEVVHAVKQRGATVVHFAAREVNGALAMGLDHRTIAGAYNVSLKDVAEAAIAGRYGRRRVR